MKEFIGENGKVIITLIAIAVLLITAELIIPDIKLIIGGILHA